MNTKITSLRVLVAASLLTTGCASESEETASDQAAFSGQQVAAAPFKCTLTMTESVPVKLVAFDFVDGVQDGCGDGAQITKTVNFNEASPGAKVLCSSKGQGGGNGTGNGVALFHFRSKVKSVEFEMKPECNPSIPIVCVPQMTGQGVAGFSVMLSGSSADKTEKMTIVSGTFMPKLDKAAGTVELSVLGTHSFVDLEAGIAKGGDGSASTLAMLSAPKLHLRTTFDAKTIDEFKLTDDLELSCTR